MSDVAKPVAAPVAARPVSVAQVAPAKAPEAAKVVENAPAKPAEATAPAKERKPRGRSSELHGKVIYLVEAKIREKMPEGRETLNPKREGTKGYKAFALYQNGQKVEEFLKLASETKHEGEPVGSMADIRWDKDHGFIELKDA